jgi:hypothetical protein
VKPVKRQTKAKAKEDKALGKEAGELEVADLIGKGGVLGPEHAQVTRMTSEPKGHLWSDK